MAESITRRSALASLSCLSVAGLALADVTEMGPPADLQSKGCALDPKMIKQFVMAAHSSLDDVKAMLREFPLLVNATWDWGSGDFETALGGAAHTGNREIATFLLEKGARLDVFAAAMLGNLDVVKSICTMYPGTIGSSGPHGISLVAHAERGGHYSEAVLKYLLSAGC